MNIYVSNISFKLNEGDLQEAFAEFGEVSSVKIITDKFTGKSKGFGFVEMDNDDEAENAIEQLNGTELGGRELQVKKALPKTENSGGGRSFSNNGGGNRYGSDKGGFKRNNNNYDSKKNNRY
ncbi:MAG: RNA-binding protein [Thermoflexibacter sp.]|jgi:RNA recognition motif-containing protein|nr:RNA-binding protein [Thermoflexibacter sp.]